MKEQSKIPADIFPVQKRFEQWRETRASRREAIPEELWSEAIVLLSQYRPSVVARALRLNQSQLNRRAGKQQMEKPALNSKKVVVTRLELSAPVTAFAGAKITRPDGLCFELPPSLPADLLISITRVFSEGIKA